MFKKLANRLHLVLKKGQNCHILWQLMVNYILLLKLRIYKLIKGIHHPIVHYYALCWNEEKMLPFMFDYYGQFVDKFVIYDNYSTDRSEEIIKSHKNAEIIKFKSDGFNDIVHIDIKNNCWKKSRGKADYVVVCDMDEFIYHPQMKRFLKESMQNGISFFHLHGYEMYSEMYPQYDGKNMLTDLVKTGVESEKYGKSILFDPNCIVEINYLPGAHECYPIGRVKELKDCDLKMLHYKWLDINIMLDRVKICANRLSSYNIDNKYGIEYLKSEETIKQEFVDQINKCQIVI